MLPRCRTFRSKPLTEFVPTFHIKTPCCVCACCLPPKAAQRSTMALKIPMGSWWKAPAEDNLENDGMEAVRTARSEVEPSAARVSGDRDQRKARSLVRCQRCQEARLKGILLLIFFFCLRFCTFTMKQIFRHLKQISKLGLGGTRDKIGIRKLKRCSFQPYFFAFFISRIWCRYA